MNLARDSENTAISVVCKWHAEIVMGKGGLSLIPALIARGKCIIAMRKVKKFIAKNVFTATDKNYFKRITEWGSNKKIVAPYSFILEFFPDLYFGWYSNFLHH